MREQILSLLNSSKSYNVKEIAEALGIANENEVRTILGEMCDNLELFQTKKNRYISFKNCLLEKGKISIAKGGYGFVNYGGERDAFIHSNNLNGAINGDTVAIEILKKEKDKVEAKVVKIASRKLKPFIGEVVVKKKRTYVLLDNTEYEFTAVLDGQNSNIVDKNIKLRSLLMNIPPLSIFDKASE
jgi:ribonuclease R